LLEIGTGWGELALRAAARGASVTSLTISPAQFEVATKRAADAGLASRIDVRLSDYREAEGSYDAVVSVEMIEAVGTRYWPAYFRTIDRVLAPGGRAGIQAITMPHDQMLATMNGQTWIHQYIFPGGQIPSLRAISDALASHTDLRVTSDLAMGGHYARTLSQWRVGFASAEDEVGALGFSRSFQRMWALYLAYAQAGFAAGYLDVHQLVLERNGGRLRGRGPGPGP
jgi:cyclopropane-fatty-acyl-phospholipid synthase